jgi:hypothetical protein
MILWWHDVSLVGILNFLVTQLQLLNPIAIVVGSLEDRQSHIQWNKKIILGNPREGKNPATKILNIYSFNQYNDAIYLSKKYQDQNTKRTSLQDLCTRPSYVLQDEQEKCVSVCPNGMNLSFVYTQQCLLKKHEY